MIRDSALRIPALFVEEAPQNPALPRDALRLLRRLIAAPGKVASALHRRHAAATAMRGPALLRPAPRAATPRMNRRNCSAGNGDEPRRRRCTLSSKTLRCAISMRSQSSQLLVCVVWLHRRRLLRALSGDRPKENANNMASFTFQQHTTRMAVRSGVYDAQTCQRHGSSFLQEAANVLPRSCG